MDHQEPLDGAPDSILFHDPRDAPKRGLGGAPALPDGQVYRHIADLDDKLPDVAGHWALYRFDELGYADSDAESGRTA